jgi:hypothetical protein
MSYSKEQRIINSMHGSTISDRARPARVDIADGYSIPNHSGLTNHREFKTKTRAWDLTILSPKASYGIDGEIFLLWTIEPIYITNIRIELDADTNQVAGDLKYADDFITQANAVVINDFDTTAGKRNDSSITNSSVDMGKAIYLDFDSEPHEDIKQMHVHIEYYLQ